MNSRDWEDTFEEDPENYDSAVNHFQPEKDNPHDVDQNEDEDAFFQTIRKALDNRLDLKTQEFEDEEVSERHLYLAAAEISKQLAHEFDEGEGYLIAEVGPEGVSPIAMGDEEEFYVDERYNPEELEGTLSPLELMDRTGYNEQIGFSVMNYSLSDLTSQEIDLWDSWPISKDQMDSNNYRIIVAPGLGEEYQEMAEEVTKKDEILD